MLHEPKVYDLNESATIDGYSQYVAFKGDKFGLDAVIRVAIHNWIEDENLHGQFLTATERICTVPCVATNLKDYQIKSVLFQKIKSGVNIGYWKTGWGPNLASYSKGYTDLLAATDATWIVDIVFKITGNIDYIEYDCEVFEEVLSKAVQGISTRGKPVVKSVSIFYLRPSSMSPEPLHERSRSQTDHELADMWGQIQPFFEVIHDPVKKDCIWRKINANGSAWELFPHWFGTEGKGVARGSALDILSAKPVTMKTSGQIISGGQTEGTAKPWAPYGYNTKEPVWDWQTIPIEFKLGGVVAGALLYFYGGKYFRRFL